MSPREALKSDRAGWSFRQPFKYAGRLEFSFLQTRKDPAFPLILRLREDNDDPFIL